MEELRNVWVLVIQRARGKILDGREGIFNIFGSKNAGHVGGPKKSCVTGVILRVKQWK